MTEHEHASQGPEKKPAPDDVATKAYAIHLKEGRPQGHDVQNWLEAEAQLRHAGSDHPDHEPALPVLSANRLGCGVGATATLFYLACMLVMAMLPRDTVIVLFNSLLHGLDVGPILQMRVPGYEVLIGLISTFILGWIAGALVAGFYNWGLRRR